MRQAPEPLLSDFPRGDPDRTPVDDTPDEFKPPTAAFTSPDMMRDPLLAWRPGKLFLGVIDGVPQKDGRGRLFITGGVPIGVDDDRHIITFAGSRAGKGRAAIIPNMLHWPGSVLATDPKGELAMITARRRVALGQKVHVLDPFDVTAGGYPEKAKLRKGFNPIARMRAGQLVEDAALIADALVVGEGKDPHWDESARAFIEGIVLHVRTWPDYEGRRNLFTVRELVGLAGGSDTGLAADMGKNPAAGGVVKSAKADFFDRPENERGSVLSTVRRHLKFIDLFRENALGRLTIEQDDFGLDELKTTATTLYLCLPARHIGTCNRWLRLFVNLTMQGMERTRVRPDAMPGRVPVLFVLDEFAALGKLKQVEDAAGQIAGHGVKLWPILQDMGQLKSLYAERWETFLGNAGIVQFFGNNDLTTLEWISKRCGKTSIIKTRKSDLTVSQRMAAMSGETQDVAVHELLTLDEAARFFGRNDWRLRQLVIWAGLGHPLLVAQRAYYDHHELFRDLWDNPPDA